MRTKNKMHKAILITIITITILAAQTLPIFFPRPLGGQSIEDENIILYYQKGDEVGANEVFDLLKEKSSAIYDQMNFESQIQTKVYLYKTQWQLAIREAGFATLIIAPPWHIGDSHNGNIMMVSPYASVSVHTHDSILLATLHELVHSINYQINPDISYFWDNGLATYLSEQKPSDNDLFSHQVPSLDDMHTENGLKFGEMGGYAFSYNYVEYINQTYGWESIIDFITENKSYEAAFNKTEEEIYFDWCQHLENSQTNIE